MKKKHNLRSWVCHGLIELIKMMRFTIILVLVSISQVFAVSSYSQQAKLSLDMNNARLEEVIDEIEKTSDFFFLYNKNMVDVDQTVNIKVAEKNVDEILNSILRGTDVAYSINERQIFLFKDNSLGRNGDLSGQLLKVVEGKVVDVDGTPLPGVTVVVAGTTNGTVTNDVGQFRLNNIPADAVLVFSFVGMETLEVPVKGKKDLQVILKEKAIGVDEVVVIGYGSVSKRDLTGSVSSIKSEDLMQTNPQGINQALQGRLAGVQVQQADGAPGSGINILIRGANSFTTSNEPLYIVDGVPFEAGEAPAPGTFGDKQRNNPLSLINPNDIESIEVLKDASATAIYGSRAANGVVIITTKGRGVAKAKVTFSSKFGISNVVSKIDVLDAGTYAEYRNEQAINGYTYDGKEYVGDDFLPFPVNGRWSYSKETDPETGLEMIVDSTYLPGPDDFRNGYEGGGTNWQDQIFQTAVTQEYNLSFSEGNENGHYLFSAGMLDQEGVIVNSFYKRYTVRSNISKKISEWIEVGNNLSITKSTNRLARTNSENYGVIPSSISFNPTRPVFDPDRDSGYTEDTSSGLANPYLYTRTAKNLVGALNIFNSAFAEISFTDFLKFRQNLGYGNNKNTRNEYYNRWVAEGLAPKNGYGRQADNFYESTTLESILKYNKEFNEVHRVDAVVAWTYENVNWGGKTMSATGFPNDLTEENDMGAALHQETNSSTRGESSLMSYLGRVNYSLFDKYLFTVSYRRDGSSRFSKENRWSDFSSVAFAWRLSDENFIKNLGFFDDLKLRASYGQTGNQGISAYATRSRMVALNYPYDGSLASGYAESRWGGPANPNLKWETTTQGNLGLDITMLDKRVNVNIDLYHKKTVDLLQNRFIPASTGFSTLASNYGEVENKGLEVAGSVYVFSRRNFSWKIDANASFNQNKVDGLEADQFSDVAWGLESMFLRRNGEPIGLIYGYQEDGFYDSEAEVRADPQFRDETDSRIRSMIGQVKYKDTNGDKVVDDRDKVIIGNTNPKVLYGLTNSITWKDFSMSFFLQGTYGNDILNVNIKRYSLSGFSNMPHFIYDNRWTPENREGATSPRPDGTFTRSMKASDRYVEDGSYVRLKNLNFSYLFRNPARWIESLQLNASVNNLFTITKYRWYDPDVNTFGGDVSRRGVDMASYPSARTVTFGFKLEF
ncbi:TonB-dependent receptor [Sunxiuqinia elliptica]|uniref:TonB-linked outer membrane protein, SusC/RagA family n=1 Tax=Sunxiuqinia elliptica TaxID=655355 RepID=A0A1I2KLF0_9BACT|nr:TonB-dependent receptor [Sunxiuqinia elliptica]SFF67805.1 TonB-linked outer membrane protein, SusC/RagA family [Sunxiuqinia elliptica]